MTVVQAMVELTSGDQTWKAIVRSKVKENIWRIFKIPGCNRASDKRMKAWFQKQLKLSEKEFEVQWDKKNAGIRCLVNDTLRIQRAYVLQQMKIGYYGESLQRFIFVPLLPCLTNAVVVVFFLCR